MKAKSSDVGLMRMKNEEEGERTNAVVGLGPARAVEPTERRTRMRFEKCMMSR